MTTPTRQTERLDRTVTASSVAGTAIEWYDFYIYGTSAALVFNVLFFPKLDPVTGTLVAFGAFGVGFLARPFGAIVFGHFGDRIGRKKMLYITLLGMGTATVLIGFLPTYDAVGILAPILLIVLRLVQGFCVGGEWGGAMLLSVEHAPDSKRNLAGALVQTGSPAGLVLATVIFALFNTLPHDAFISWGWRIPFLLSAVLVVVGLIVRLRVEETPEFARIRKEGQTKRVPLFSTLAHYPGQVVIGIALTLAPFAFFYFLAIFLLSFGVNELKLSSQFLLLTIAGAAVVEIFMLPLAGVLADRFGNTRIFSIGAIVLMVFAFPMMWLLVASTNSPFLAVVAIFVTMTLLHPLSYGPLSNAMAELFAPDIRYTGVSLAFQLGGVVGGFTPLIFQSFLANNTWSVAVPLYLMISGALSLAGILVAAVLARRHSRSALAG